MARLNNVPLNIYVGGRPSDNRVLFKTKDKKIAMFVKQSLDKPSKPVQIVTKSQPIPTKDFYYKGLGKRKEKVLKTRWDDTYEIRPLVGGKRFTLIKVTDDIREAKQIKKNIRLKGYYSYATDDYTPGRYAIYKDGKIPNTQLLKESRARVFSRLPPGQQRQEMLRFTEEVMRT